MIAVGAAFDFHAGTLPQAPKILQDYGLEWLFRLAHEDPSSDELAKARTIVESDAVYQKETVQGMARKLGYYPVFRISRKGARV